jgi:hypothetical protein
MKTFTTFMAESKQDLSPHELEVHQALMFHAGTDRASSMGAAKYHRAAKDDVPEMLKHFHEKIAPIWKSHGSPRPGDPSHPAFEKEVRDMWRKEPR